MKLLRLVALFIAAIIAGGTANAFPATATDGYGVVLNFGAGHPCDVVDYHTNPWMNDPNISSRTYCVPRSVGSSSYAYGWSERSDYYGWPGVSFPCGNYSCKQGYVEWAIGTINMSCPANSTLVGSQCVCNENYAEHPLTHKSCVPVVEINLGQKPPPPKTCGEGNPIYPLTGAKKEFVRTGISLGEIELILTYDSTDKLPANTSSIPTALVEPNAFGALWKSSFHHKLQVSVNKAQALLARGNGEVLNFNGNGAGAFTTDSDNPHRLVSIPGGYRFIDTYTGDQETFDSSGKLTSIATGRGMVLTFSYANGNLARVQASDGRAVQFTYLKNLISKITDAAGETITPAYDSNRNLTALTWQDGKTRRFLYENMAFPWALTGKVDENTSREATFVYDSNGRAISTEKAGGIQRFSVSYGSAPQRTVTENFDANANILYRIHGWQMPEGVSLTQPNGESVGLGAADVGGVPALVSRSQPAGSGCAASTSSLTHDASGNILSEDDFNGVRTCYAYVGKKEVVRVEGLSNKTSCDSVISAGATLPAGARKITTDWHPLWRMPATVVQPLRTTTVVYHGNGDTCTTAPSLPNGEALPLICKRVEQALLADGTVDSSVAASVARYAYDPAGRVLSSVDANGKTTTFAYYSDTAFDSGDVYFDSVSLLLQAEGANGSLTFSDSSPSPKAVSAVGSGVSLSTALSKFGVGSIAFGGSGNLSFADGGDTQFGAGDFTIELWFYQASTAGYGLISNRPPSAAGWALQSNALRAYYNGSWSDAKIVWSAPAANAWHHLALVRVGATLRVFVDGVQQGTSSISGSWSDGATNTIVIGASTNNGEARLVGNVDGLRITKGVARYTANFTPPTQEFANNGPSSTATGHTMGDLQSLTNAAGHVTRYTQYDRASRVRQMVDAKGVTTEIVYTPRGWTSGVTTTAPSIAPFTTGYVYDDAGQLKQVNLPDGTSLGYDYDAAHRLVGITDTRGNSVTYSLDSVGSRTGEEVRDPTGTLRRSISRSFDALNRLQQVTGAP